jgi:glyoxylase-like metal-dependent hydrolase (beta-lactamase superfamily II)
METGFGPKLPPKQREIFGIPRSLLLEDLAGIGVRPGDVDIVINSHLHGDHSGGNTTLEDGEVKTTFPNATYIVQEKEWADATHPNERTAGLYLSENFSAVHSSQQLRLISGDTWITDEVQCFMTPGHTRGNQSVWIRSGGQNAVFIADLAPTVTHLERIGWATAFDMEPMVTLETKRNLIPRLLETSALLFFSHDPNVPVGRLTSGDKGLRVVPEE